MASGRQSETSEYVVDHRMIVDLAAAHRRSVADLQHEFSEENESAGMLHGISQGFAHEIHNLISEMFPTVNMLNASRVHIEDMLEIHEIRTMEGSRFKKALVISAILDSVADAVADAIWERSTGTDIDVALRDALAIGDVESKQVLDAYDGLYQRVKMDFGL